MNEKTLILICALLSIVGIVSLFFLNKSVQIPQLKIYELKDGMNFVKIVGRVTSKYVSKTGTTFLTVQDGSGKIQAIIFKGMNNQRIGKGDRVEIIGDVQTYKNKLEIIVKQIRVI